MKFKSLNKDPYSIMRTGNAWTFLGVKCTNKTTIIHIQIYL